jgi:hypothetical protein
MVGTPRAITGQGAARAWPLVALSTTVTGNMASSPWSVLCLTIGERLAVRRAIVREAAPVATVVEKFLLVGCGNESHGRKVGIVRSLGQIHSRRRSDRAHLSVPPPAALLVRRAFRLEPKDGAGSDQSDPSLGEHDQRYDE